jgi:hypothetical protein
MAIAKAGDESPVLCRSWPRLRASPWQAARTPHPAPDDEGGGLLEPPTHEQDSMHQEEDQNR